MNNINESIMPLAVPISDLKHMEDNPRVGDVKAVMKSYEAFGQRKPIVARRVDKTVIAGNHQLAAARELGWDKIAVVWVDDDDETATAYAVADNSVGLLGEWDTKNLIKALSKIDENLLESTGFTINDILEFSSYENDSMVASTENKNKSVNDKDIQNVKEKVETVKSYNERLELYEAKKSRAFLMEYPLNIYLWVQESLTEYKNKHKIASNTEAFIKLIEELN